MNEYTRPGDVLRKKYIHIYQCKPGDIIADDVYDNSGFLVMPRNTVIDDKVLGRLKTYRVRQVSVYERQNEQDVSDSGIQRTITVNGYSGGRRR